MRGTRTPGAEGAWVVRLGAAAAAALALAGCSGSSSPASTTPPASPTLSSSPTPDEPSSSPAADGSPTPTTDPGTTASPAFGDVDGRWCLADDPTVCMTIALPALVNDAYPDDTEYVYPAADDPGDPSSWSYADLAPGADGCFQTAVDVFPAVSGAAFIYCPAGAVSAEMNDLAGDPSVDRVFITQEVDVMPFHRADG